MKKCVYKRKRLITLQATTSSRALFEKSKSLRDSRNFTLSTGPKHSLHSLPCSQDLLTSPCHQPDQFSPYRPSIISCHQNSYTFKLLYFSLRRNSADITVLRQNKQSTWGIFCNTVHSFISMTAVSQEHLINV
jgi:hypothetical protein